MTTTATPGLADTEARRERLEQTANPGRESGLGPALFGFFVFLVALWAQTNAVVGTFYDDGIYVVLARALAEGEGYRNIHLPGAPAAVHYPFLYPALLSLLWRLWPSFPENLTLFELFDSATLGGAAWVLAAATRRLGLPAAARYAALAVGFTAFPLLTLVGVRFSEPLFLLILAGAAATVDRDSPGVHHALVAGVLAGFSFLARSIGIAVIAAVPLALWYRGARRSAVAAFLLALLIASPWIAWTTTHAGEIDPRIAANYGTYLTEAHQAGAEAFLVGLDGRALSPLARLTIPLLPLGLWYPLAALLIVTIFWGGVRLWARTPALIGSLGVYTLVVSLWPYVPDRFIWIMLPLYALCVAEGIRALWRRGRVGQVAVAVLALALTVGYARREVNSLLHRHFARTSEEASLPISVLSAAIASGTPAEAVVAAESEAAVHLYTGRRTVPYHLFNWEGRHTEDLPADAVLGWFCDNSVTHVALSTREGVVAPLVARLETPGARQHQRLFALGRGPSLYRFGCDG